MLFHVTMTVRMPRDIDPEKVKRLGEQEHELGTSVVALCGHPVPSPQPIQFFNPHRSTTASI